MRRIEYRFRAATSPESAGASVGTGALARPSRAKLGSCQRSRQLWISHRLRCAPMIMSLILSLTARDASTTASAATRPHYGGTLRVMLQSAPGHARPSRQRHARRLLGRRAHPLADRRHSRKTGCASPPAARAGCGMAERPDLPALAIHAAARSEVPRRQRGIACSHRADSGRNPLRLECACSGGFRIDRERNAHACAARRTRAAAQSPAQAQYKSSSHRHRPVPHRRVAARETAQARRQ